jgi:glycerol-3-phosphate dehydrogenase subunit C
VVMAPDILQARAIMTTPPFTPSAGSHPRHELYVDEATVRDELTRVFQICYECRRCESYCTTFPSLFELIERRDDHDAGRLTPLDQDLVVDSCVQCNLCSASCPYTPVLSELGVEVPQLVLRAKAMQHATGISSWRSKAVARSFGHADLIGRTASATSGLANRLVAAEPGSFVRRLFARITGVSANRRLRLYRAERFTTWFDNRPRVRLGNPQGSVTVFPTCLVEYRNTAIGADLVKVYERNGIECSTSAAGCCGAPSLHAGDIDRFAKIAKRNVRALASEVRSGTDIVVPQPGCGVILRSSYVDHVPEKMRHDAELVAAHTYDASEYLMRLHRADSTVIDTDFRGATFARITSVGSGHLTDRHAEFDSRDLLRLTGARVQQIRGTSGIETPWGLRADNDAVADSLAGRLARRIGTTSPDAVAADDDFANAAISEQLDVKALHPMQIVARAYGLSERVPRDHKW